MVSVQQDTTSNSERISASNKRNKMRAWSSLGRGVKLQWSQHTSGYPLSSGVPTSPPPTEADYEVITDVALSPVGCMYT